jgi:hypothetical protein
MLRSWQSFRQNPLRWVKRRYLRWFALTYWSYRWATAKGAERKEIQLHIVRVAMGFDRAAWLLAMGDMIKPEYWVM